MLVAVKKAIGTISAVHIDISTYPTADMVLRPYLERFAELLYGRPDVAGKRRRPTLEILFIEHEHRSNCAKPAPNKYGCEFAVLLNTKVACGLRGKAKERNMLLGEQVYLAIP